MSNKDLKYYKALDYNIIIEKEVEDGESWFIAYARELGKFACYGRGETQAEALKSFIEEKNAFIEFLFNAGKFIPAPKQEEAERFRGVFNVRTSPAIHANLVNQAKEMDISLNLYLNQIITAAVEKKSTENVLMNKLFEICNKLEKHHYEVTNQLRYQKATLQYPNDWVMDYSDPYQKIA
jgi:predicted HicB family RNase H-like nuclease